MEAQLRSACCSFMVCGITAATAMTMPWQWAWVAIGLIVGSVLGLFLELKFGGFLGLFTAVLLMLSINDEQHINAVVAGIAAVLSAAFMLFARLQYNILRKTPR